MNKLDQLRAMTAVVADTGALAEIRRWRPEDATTNPSLLRKAVEEEAEGRAWLAEAVAAAKADGGEDWLELALDQLAVAVGAEITRHIPGRVSTEVSARCSFDVDATVARAERLVSLYERRGVPSSRVLIKVAATWEGIRAAATLERRGIHCNLTLLFSFPQAQACADAGVTLISPFVGRLSDWHRAKSGRDFPPEEDPGVRSVRRIYHYYKGHGYATEVMGASFRTTGQIEALAGCDRLTIAPSLLAALAADEGPLVRRLDPARARPEDPREHLAESEFRWRLNEDAAATELLADGIRRFYADERRLAELLTQSAR
ncbi:MAG: transaldolase [Porticoccaceae bacterium]|nr:MAG: transaldolase [Porticoccaceae bacterium]